MKIASPLLYRECRLKNRQKADHLFNIARRIKLRIPLFSSDMTYGIRDLFAYRKILTVEIAHRILKEVEDTRGAGARFDPTGFFKFIEKSGKPIEIEELTFERDQDSVFVSGFKVKGFPHTFIFPAALCCYTGILDKVFSAVIYK